MDDDEKIARRALAMSKTNKDIRMLDVPGYSAWSQRKLREGESDALIAHLDATSMWLAPGELVSEDVFEELLDDIKERVGGDDDD